MLENTTTVMPLSDVYHLFVTNGKTVWMASFPLGFLSKDELSMECRMPSLKLNKKKKKGRTIDKNLWVLNN